MEKTYYSEEFKEMVVKECEETGNSALVARKHQISPNTVQTWRRKKKLRGKTGKFSRNKDERLKAVEKQLKEVSTENTNLKQILADKELELAILRDLRDTSNPK